MYRVCKSIEKATLILLLFSTTVFLICHYKYINSGHCMEQSIIGGLSRATEFSNSSINRKNKSIAKAITLGAEKAVIFDDDILRIAVVPSKLNTASFEPQYEFSVTGPILYLSEAKRVKHNFRAINVTLEGDCIGSYWLAKLAGIDTIVINQLMFSLESDGLVQNLNSGEFWNWRGKSISENKMCKVNTNFLCWIWTRFSTVLYTSVVFAVMSGITAVMIRILVSSGVVFVFPLFFCIRRFFVQELDMRVLMISYPWLGVELQHIMRERKSALNFLCSHFMYLITFYIIYEVSQMSWATYVYGKSYPVGLPMIMASLLMVLEYFSMVYLRSLTSIIFFPKMIAFLFVTFHIYFFTVAYGFYYFAALLTCEGALLSVLWFVLNAEVPAMASGLISNEIPRARYVKITTPSWRGAVANIFTVFHPVGNDTFPVVYEGPAEAQDEGMDMPALPQNNDESEEATLV